MTASGRKAFILTSVGVMAFGVIAFAMGYGRVLERSRSDWSLYQLARAAGLAEPSPSERIDQVLTYFGAAAIIAGAILLIVAASISPKPAAPFLQAQQR